MQRYIANFGRRNYMWPDCLERSTVATFEDEDLRPYWIAGDRRGYIDYCVQNKKTAANITPTPAVASRWFEIGNIIASTVGDLWLHTDGDDLWWTVSRAEPAQVSLVAPRSPWMTSASRVYEIHKPAEKWSKTSQKGKPLRWSGLHPKARDFLVTQSTLASLSDANAAYATALIEGEDLSPWHSQPLWKVKESNAKSAPVTHWARATERFGGWSKLLSAPWLKLTVELWNAR
jgi:hypothetical protein